MTQNEIKICLVFPSSKSLNFVFHSVHALNEILKILSWKCKGVQIRIICLVKLTIAEQITDSLFALFVSYYVTEHANMV